MADCTRHKFQYLATVMGKYAKMLINFVLLVRFSRKVSEYNCRPHVVYIKVFSKKKFREYLVLRDNYAVCYRQKMLHLCAFFSNN